MTKPDLKIPFLAVMGLSLVALFPMPYGYYTFLRIAVTLTAGATAYLNYQEGEKGIGVWLYFAIAVLFNPIIPIHLDKDIWMVFNIFTVAVFGYGWWKLKEKAKVE